MTTVRIQCPRCGALVQIPIDALLVTIAADEDDALLAGHVTWLCAACADVAAAPVGWRSLLTLLTEGASLLDEDGDDLPLHPESPADGPAFTPDDQLELHQLLATDSWFDALTAAACTNP